MRENILRLFSIVSCLFILTTITACSTTPWTFFSTRINAQILASFNINPDINKRPSPIVVRIYELKSVDVFNSADFFKIYDEEKATLGGDLITREEFEFSPGEGRQVSLEADDQTRYFGVIAAYRNIDKSRWRASAALKLNSKNSLVVKIGKQKVTIFHQ